MACVVRFAITQGEWAAMTSSAAVCIMLPATADAAEADRTKVADALGKSGTEMPGGGKAAITGDFVLTAKEMNPVLRALRENGIEVTAVHNHMLDHEPRLFFMHFWVNDDEAKLAKGLRAALDKVNVARS